MTSYSPSLDDLRTLFDSELSNYLGARREEVPESADLLGEIERVIASGGKRLRPAFCYWGYRAGGGDHGPGIVRLAIGFELLHTFALVHDDIMDSSEQRRGVPTSYAQLGLDRALLVGDLALVLADRAFTDAGFAPKELADARRHYSLMQQQVIAGQYLDVAASADIDRELARRIALLKSGSYSIQGPLVIGALLAGAADETVTALGDIGAAAGEAFQLRDDLLGLFGDPAVTGKSIDSDVRDGKRNLLFALTAERATPPERDRFVARWGAADLTPEEIEWLRGLVESSGARAATEEAIRDLNAGALARLEATPIPEDARSALRELIAAAAQRVS